MLDHEAAPLSCPNLLELPTSPLKRRSGDSPGAGEPGGLQKAQRRRLETFLDRGCSPLNTVMRRALAEELHENALDCDLTIILLSFAEGSCSNPITGLDPGGLPPQRVKFSTFDFSTCDAPSPNNRESLLPFEKLHLTLGEALKAAARLREKLADATESKLACHNGLANQVRAVVEAAGRAGEGHSHEERRAAAFVQKELAALCFVDGDTGGCDSGSIERRWCQVTTSLIRFELKHVLNRYVLLKPGTGNLLQNYEDPAALFHHALKVLGAAGGIGVAPSLPLDEMVADALVSSQHDPTGFLLPVVIKLCEAKGGCSRNLSESSFPQYQRTTTT
jgi:hypothetical protein